MKITAKIPALLLAGAIMLPLLASCDSSPNSATDSTTTGTPEATTTAVPNTPEPELTASERYATALNALMKKINSTYYNKRTSHVLRGEPDGGSAAVWGFAAYLEALADWYRLFPENSDTKSYYVDALDNGLALYRVTGATLETPAGRFENITYYNATANGTGDYYYDDDAWICYQLLYAYEQLGDEKYLTWAKELLEFFKTGWDEQLGGGIYWDKSFEGKNTCGNGPIAICFLWAHRITGEADYLEWGQKIYDWMYKNLRDGALYNDALGIDGGKNNWKADYNQGTPIYAACLLYEITGDQTYLDHAKTTAEAAIDLAFTSSGRKNNIRVTMNGNPIFKSWCVGWLMRGFYKYIEISGDVGNYFTYMEIVLDKTLETKDRKGFYDPYFCTGDWTDQSVTDVLQQSGFADVIALCLLYERELAPDSE